MDISNFDAAEYLDSDEAIAAYLNEALATDDPALIADAIGVVARAKGMTEIAASADVGRESLYKSLSQRGNPEFATVVKIMHALGMKLEAHPTV